MISMEAKDVLIRTMPTPNPYAVKFVTNFPFKETGKASFASPMECESFPLFRDVFLIDGIKQVHVFENTMTVTHAGDMANETLSELVSSVIRSRAPVHNPDFETSDEKKKATAPKVHSDPLLTQIEEILNRTIRPGLQADGGDIEIAGLNGSELQIIYQGACGGCPSSMMGTLDAIQGILQYELGREDLYIVPV